MIIKTLANINEFYKARDNAIQSIHDYGRMILEAREQALIEQYGKGLKMQSN